MSASKKLFVSVDVDDWYFARWATGASNSIWANLPALYKGVYNAENPPNRLEYPIQQILELFESLHFKSTFFITGYIAEKFPTIVKIIANEGHEIACHNFHHIDYEYVPVNEFRADLKRSKSLLEQISGQSVIGYRSPNSSIPAYLVEELLAIGFLYDSSVTPTRRIMGKFGAFTNAPLYPYTPAKENIGKQGDANLVEIPWAVFPYIKFPSGSGITHRLFGNLYNQIATQYSIEQGGITSYYFHPYEITDIPELKGVKLPLKARIFLRKCGEAYYKDLKKFLIQNQSRLINGQSVAKQFKFTA